MRTLIERLRLALRDWLNAPSAAELKQQAGIDQAVAQMRRDMARGQD